MATSDTPGRLGQPQSLRHEPLYTDMGPGLELRDSEGVTSPLSRYAVWKWDAAKGKHQVAEVGDDLEDLRAKHGEGPLVDLPSLRKRD